MTNAMLQRCYEYLKFLDETNAKILKGITYYGPRNLTRLAKAINLPITTVGFRLKKLIKAGLLCVTVNPNLLRLGLTKAFFIAEAKLGHHEALKELITNIDYWTYIIRCYGKMDGYCAYIAFPTNYKKELEKYFHEASKTQIFSRYNFYWITNSHFVPPDFSWYDFKKKEWQFNWRKWLDEILNAPVDLPEVLKEENSRIMVDKKDLILIKELEKNAMINFKKLAETLKITPQSVGARYQNHIIQRKLVIEYIVDIYPFPAQFSDLYNFIIDFKSEKALAKFVNASDGKPFIVSYAKIMGRNSLIVNIYILKEEFPNLIKSLNQLYRAGLINSLFYVTLDPTSYRRQTISYEFFNDGKWSYDAEAKMKKLKEISELH